MRRSSSKTAVRRDAARVRAERDVAIYRLHTQGWQARKIARALKLSPSTVSERIDVMTCVVASLPSPSPPADSSGT